VTTELPYISIWPPCIGVKGAVTWNTEAEVHAAYAVNLVTSDILLQSLGTGDGKCSLY
jgi:hypothetical protein